MICRLMQVINHRQFKHNIKIHRGNAIEVSPSQKHKDLIVGIITELCWQNIYWALWKKLLPPPHYWFDFVRWCCYFLRCLRRHPLTQAPQNQMAFAWCCGVVTALITPTDRIVATNRQPATTFVLFFIKSRHTDHIKNSYICWIHKYPAYGWIYICISWGGIFTLEELVFFLRIPHQRTLTFFFLPLI